MTSSPPFLCRVSSTLNNDVENLGKKFMFDNDEETCWNSAEGSPQWIEILFKGNRQVTGLEFQFQGGFVGQDCRFEFFTRVPCEDKNPDFVFEDFYPEDVNSVQIYHLKIPIDTKKIRIIFKSSTDTYGRIIMYKLSVLNANV